MKIVQCIVLTFILSFSFQFIAQNPNWQWAKNSGGNNDESSNSVVTDAAGNVFVTGNFASPTMIFGSFTLTNVNNYDVFLVKYDPLGNVLWAKSGGGIFDDIGWGVATDAPGNVIITGSFYSPTIIFDTYTLSSSGGADIFVVKYDVNGNIIWAKNEGGNFNDNGFGIASDINNNILITGSFRSAAFVTGTTTLTNTGIDDYFIIKYDALGNTIWAKSGDGSTNDQGNGITTDAAGNIYTTGFFYSPAFILDSFTLTPQGSNDFFVTKYDAMGNVLWAKSGGGTFNDFGYGIAADVFGNVLITGAFNSPTLTAGSFSTVLVANFDILTAKYNSSGNEVWLKSHGGSDDEAGFGITSDIFGQIYIAGHFHSPSVVIGTFTLSNQGIGDIYIARYDALGNILWANNEGGASDEQGTSLAIDASSNIYVAGYFYSPTLTIGSNTLISSGMSDMFVAKLESIVTINSEKLLKLSDALVYPNPSSGQIHVLNSKSKINKLEIYNLMGEKSSETDIHEITDSAVNMSIPLKGIYFLKIFTDEGIISKRLIIQ